MSNIVEDGFDEILRQRLAECEAATVERCVEALTQLASSLRKGPTPADLSAAAILNGAELLSALSPDPDWLKRKELEARRDELRRWSAPCTCETHEAIDKRIADLDRQLKALGKEKK